MKTFNNYFIDSFLIEKYINEGLSKNTILTYEVVLKTLLVDGQIVNINNPNSFTELNFKKLLTEMQISNNWTSRTYNRYRKNYKVFCDYLVKETYISINPISNIKERKINKTLPKFYNKNQVSLILYTLNNLYNGIDYKSIRDRTIIYTYLYTGLRLYELINLKISSINLDENYIIIKHGKGGKDRIIPIIDKLKKILNIYMQTRYKINKTKEDNLFVTIFGGSLQHREIYSIIRNLKNKLGFPLTTHMFRHTFATELARNDVNIFNIAQILGHSKLETTKIYLNFNVESIKQNLDNINLFT